MTKARLLALAVLAAGFLILIAGFFTSSLSPYKTVSELVDKKLYDSSVQVIGNVTKQSLLFNVDSGILTFDLTDGKKVLTVRFEGMVNNIGNATEVVAVGKYGRDNIFYAAKILVKCPSKYVEKPEV